MIKDYFQMPVNSTWISVGYNSKHTALDMGWTYEAGRNQPVYPIAKGVVVDKGWYKDGGNFIWTKHEDTKNTWYAGYMHLHNPSQLNVGARVNRKTQLGKMGMTGHATGPHVHFVLVKAPKGTKWSNSGTRKYRVNPAKHLYRFPHQTVKSGAVKIKSKPKALYSPSSGKKYINIHKGKKYGTYSLDVQPVAKNIDKWLRPDKFGGMSYEIVGNTKYKDVFLIETKDFGKRQVYLDTSRASITDEPMYKARGGKSKPKSKPKPKPQSNKVTVKKTATHFSTGQKMDNWVKGSTFDVIQKGKTTTLIGRGNSVIGWVKDSDLVGNTSKPKSKIGRYANFKGNVRLFKKSRGDECYHETKDGHKNVYTNVRATSAKILDEDNGRVLVSVPRFNPNKVWIANSESTVSDKPKYRL